MKHLTLFNAIFVLFLVGKIGNVGDLGQLNWLWVISPLVINSLVNAFYYIAEVQGFKGVVANYIKLWELKKIQKKWPDIYEKAKSDYWEQLKKEQDEKHN